MAAHRGTKKLSRGHTPHLGRTARCLRPTLRQPKIGRQHAHRAGAGARRAENAGGGSIVCQHRATARWDETADIPEDAALSALLGDGGTFAITVQPKDGDPWQGIVPLEGGSIAEMLAGYMARSEQLETFITLAADVEHAGGLLLQRLPEKELDDTAWEHVCTLAQTTSAAELCGLDAQNLLYRLFHETPPRVFPPDELEFACTCSRGKVSDMLLMLGGEEVGSVVAAEGSITVDCDFCNQHYTFDENDINALFGTDVVAAAAQERHIRKTV